jgi:hypothetical protein
MGKDRGRRAEGKTAGRKKKAEDRGDNADCFSKRGTSIKL